MMATNISGTMMTSAWAPLNVASAVDAEEVDVATVATSARPITMTSSASSRPLVAFIFSTDEIKELAGKYLVNHTRTCQYSPVGAPQDERDKPGGRDHRVPGPVQRVMYRVRVCQDEVPDRRLRDRRYQRELGQDRQGKEEEPDSPEDDEEKDQIVLGRDDQEVHGHLGDVGGIEL